MKMTKKEELTKQARQVDDVTICRDFFQTSP